MIRRSGTGVKLPGGFTTWFGPQALLKLSRPQGPVATPGLAGFSSFLFFARLWTGSISHEGKMMLKRRNSTVPAALECALLFLAVSVFSWGLQAKLSTSVSTGSTAKLSTEEGSARAVASLEDQGQPRLTWESLHFAASALSQQGNHVPPTYLSQPGPGPRIPGRYYLHGPDLMRRPPPALS